MKYKVDIKEWIRFVLGILVWLACLLAAGTAFLFFVFRGT